MTESSSNFQFGFVSPPPNYQHTRSSSFSSFQFILSSQNSQPSNTNVTYEHEDEDEHYLVKYKDMKQKVKELELDNDRLHVKCLSVRKNIQRLRLERAILYERLQAINPDSKKSNPMSQNVTTPHVPATRHSDPATAAQEQPQLNSVSILDLPAPISSSVISPLETLAHSTLCERQAVLKQSVTTTMNHGSTTSFPEIRNGNHIKTFPFVHEYSTTQPRGRQQAQGRRRRRQQQQETISTIPSEYPIKVKFHQYEGGSPERQPGQRGRREIDFDEKGGKQNRRSLQQAEQLDKAAQSNARKLHIPTFRDQFIYSFQQVQHPMPQQGDLHPTSVRFFRDNI